MTFTSYLDESGVLGSLPFPSFQERQGRPLRALVRGTGSIGARHLRVLDRMGISDLLVWPVRQSTSLSERADIPASARLVDGYPAAALDLVIIATDTQRHVADTLEALHHAPAAVLLEKPVAPSVGDARVLLSHRRAGTISVSAPLRFHQGFALTAELLPKLGRVTSAQLASQSWLPSWRPGRDYRSSYSARAVDGGALRDLVHDIDYPSVLLGAPTRLRAALGHGILGIEAEESADILWDEPASVHLRLDYVTPVKTRNLRVSTDRGAITWDVVRNRVSLEWPDPAAPGNVAGVDRYFPDDADVDTILARQSMSVLQRSGVAGAPSLGLFEPASLKDGILSVAICDAARAASDSGGTEKVMW